MCLAIPAQIVEILDPAGSLAKAEISGVRRSVSYALCPDVEVGDWVLIHVGFAISQVDEQEALATLRLLEQLGHEYEQELEELKASVIE
jgi:hydrogenase expression/formation protein HypC